MTIPSYICPTCGEPMRAVYMKSGTARPICLKCSGVDMNEMFCSSCIRTMHGGMNLGGRV